MGTFSNRLFPAHDGRMAFMKVASSCEINFTLVPRQSVVRSGREPASFVPTPFTPFPCR